jgi:hypothetical protein
MKKFWSIITILAVACMVVDIFFAIFFTVKGMPRLANFNCLMAISFILIILINIRRTA